MESRAVTGQDPLLVKYNQATLRIEKLNKEIEQKQKLLEQGYLEITSYLNKLYISIEKQESASLKALIKTRLSALSKTTTKPLLTLIATKKAQIKEHIDNYNSACQLLMQYRRNVIKELVSLFRLRKLRSRNPPSANTVIVEEFKLVNCSFSCYNITGNHQSSKQALKPIFFSIGKR